MSPSDRRLSALEENVGELLEDHGSGPDLERWSEYRGRPVEFIEEVLGDELTEYQKRIARLMLEEPLLTIRSCHASGKDFLAGRLALWWVYGRQGLVVISGPTSAQVTEILMRGEVRDAFRRSGLPGELHVSALRPGGDGRAGIIAKTATGTGRLTGFHDARVLFVLTEAQDEDAAPAWDAAFAVTTGEEDRILTLGNPTRPVGRFFEAHKASSEWRAVKIAADDVPNVKAGTTVVPGLLTEAGVERFAKEYGTDSGFYQSRVLAEFPDSATDALVGSSAVEAAFVRHRSGWAERWDRDETLVAGLDVARYGKDRTCLCLRRGRRVQEFVEWGQSSTMETVGKLIDALNGRGELGIRVAVDTVGVGGGVLDRLEEVRKQQPGVRELVGRVVSFNSSEKALRNDRFLNARASTYWYLRQRLQEEKNLALPPDDELREELLETRWSVNSSGRIKIEAKDDIRGRIGRSPDKADALALTLCRAARHSGERAALVPM